MITNLELYGREDVPPIPEHVANFRIALLKENLKKLTSVHWTAQDNSVINNIIKAIGFWERLRDGEEEY